MTTARSRRLGLTVAGGRILIAALDLVHLVPQPSHPRLKGVQTCDQAAEERLLRTHGEQDLVVHLGIVGRAHAVCAHTRGQKALAHVRLGHRPAHTRETALLAHPPMFPLGLRLGSGVGWRSDNPHFGGVRGGSPAKKIFRLRLCGTHLLSLC